MKVPFSHLGTTWPGNAEILFLKAPIPSNVLVINGTSINWELNKIGGGSCPYFSTTSVHALLLTIMI